MEQQDYRNPHDKRVNGVRIENVKDQSIRDIPVDGVFVAIGRVPDTELFRGQIELDPQGYIIADETTRDQHSGRVCRGGRAYQTAQADSYRGGGRRYGFPFC